jgi:hypothetical protein
MHGRSIARRVVCARALGALGALAALGPAAALAAEAPTAPRVPGVSSDVHVTGMTFVASRREGGEVVIEARSATFRPEANVAELFDATMRAADPERGRGFDVRCDRGEFDLETNAFLAQGDVRGSTVDGQRYAAPWVRYDSDRALLFTDAPVVLEDPSGRLRGNGFRYHVRERRFELLGDVSVDSTP